LNKIITILTIGVVLWSCGDKKRNNQKYAGHDETVQKKTQPETSCEWMSTEFLDGQEVFIAPDQWPEYKGGMHNYLGLITKEIRIPQDQKLWRTIITIFVVDTLGRVRNECIMNRASTDSLTTSEREVLKGIKNHQDWIPGYHRGKKVPVKMVLPLKIGHRG
jgi:hypothetical protein